MYIYWVSQYGNLTTVANIAWLLIVMCGLGLGLKARAWASKPGLGPTNIASQA